MPRAARPPLDDHLLIPAHSARQLHGQRVNRVALDRLAAADDTVVVFTSDNGGHGGWTDNAPLRGAFTPPKPGFRGGVNDPLIPVFKGVDAARQALFYKYCMI